MRRPRSGIRFFRSRCGGACLRYFTLVWVEEPKGTGQEKGLSVVTDGLRRFARTMGQLRQMKTLLLFLVAYWFYIDGVDTIIRMAVDYGMSLGFEANSLIVALLIVQFIGFPFALLFGWLGQKWGVKKSIYLTHRHLYRGYLVRHFPDP